MLLAQIPEKVSREYFIRATNVNLGLSAVVLLISAVFCFLPAFVIWECVNDMPTAAQDSRDASVFLIGFNVILLLILLVLTVMALGSVWKHYGIILARRKRTKEEQKRQERSQNE